MDDTVYYLPKQKIFCKYNRKKIKYTICVNIFLQIPKQGLQRVQVSWVTSGYNLSSS